MRIAGDLRLRSNDDVRDRIFTLLDDAQLEYATKDAVWAATDGELDAVVAELTAMELPGGLYGALVELLTANP